MAKRQRRRRHARRQEHAWRRGWQTRHSVITGAGLVTGAALGVASPALGAAQNFTVNQLGDAGDGTCDASCTLRDAIDDANANSGQYDYIFLSALTGTINLTGGQIPITDAVYIYGPNPNQLAVAASANSRIFDIDPATAGDRVDIERLRLTGGNMTGNGGAIQNEDAQLRIFDSILSGNTASGLGGAIYEAGSYAGGFYDYISYSTFSDNHADRGGGIYADTYWGTVRSTTFQGNRAENGNGGAIQGYGGYVIDSTVSDNYAYASGGGVSVSGNNFGLYGTILANNTIDGSNPDLYSPNGGSAAFDLVEDPGTSGIGVLASVITGQDPQLGGLQNNGGDTPTLKPSASSPVVDKSYSYSYYDQRASNRHVDNPNRANAATGPYAAADIGSVELTLQEGPQATPSSPPAPPPVVHKKKKCKKKKKKKPKRSAEGAKKKCKKKKKRLADAQRGFRFASPPQPPSWGNQRPLRLGR